MPRLGTRATAFFQFGIHSYALGQDCVSSCHLEYEMADGFSRDEYSIEVCRGASRDASNMRLGFTKSASVL